MKGLQFLSLFCVALLLCACQSSGSETSPEASPSSASSQESQTDSTAKPDVPPAPSKRIIFFELVNPGLGEAYDQRSHDLIEALHGRYAWPATEGEIAFFPGTATTDSLFQENPGYNFPKVHIFYSESRIKSLRMDDSGKVRMTWEEDSGDGRYRARYKLYRNEAHRWKNYGNPGSFSFPSESQSPQVNLNAEEKLEAVLRTLVRLTYK